MEIISIANMKGGCLKTSLTVNLAYITAVTKGKKVLIVDMDQQNSVNLRFGLTDDDVNGTFLDILNGKKISKCVTPVLGEETKNNLFIISAAKESDFLALASADSKKYPKAWEEIKLFAEINEFEYIFIDTPPSAINTSLSSMIISDSIIVPAKMEQESIAGFLKLYKLLKESNLEGKIKFVVPTIIRIATKKHKTNLMKIGEFTKKTKVKLTKNYVPIGILSADLEEEGKLPAAYGKDVRGKTCYWDIAKEIGLI